MTEKVDAIAETRRAVKKCADCGDPTAFKFLDPFDKAKDRPLCLKCLKRDIGLPVESTWKALVSADPRGESATKDRAQAYPHRRPSLIPTAQHLELWPVGSRSWLISSVR